LLVKLFVTTQKFTIVNPEVNTAFLLGLPPELQMAMFDFATKTTCFTNGWHHASAANATNEWFWIRPASDTSITSKNVPWCNKTL